MNIKKALSLYAALSLAAGALLYILFRPRTLFISWLFPAGLPFRLSFPGDFLFRWYLPDALWSCALSFSLFRLHLPDGRKAGICPAIAFAFGCLWEGLQIIGRIPGTGDVLDCVAYGLGSLLALGIYYYLKRRKKS